MDQITYLEQLLKSLRARYASGDKAVEPQIRATAAKLEQLKLKEEQDKSKNIITPLAIAKAVIQKVTRRCCGR